MLDFSQWENDKEQFKSYFEAHYKPLLDKLADYPYQKIGLSDKDKRLLGFLRDDLNKIFKTAD